jgi:multidrug resistance protein MdtO
VAVSDPELRDAPGRANYTLRLTLSCAVLIVLFMTLHIPFLAVALIVVFYVSQPNVLMIKLVSVVFVSPSASRSAACC